jgi:hypothetical protein
MDFYNNSIVNCYSSYLLLDGLVKINSGTEMIHPLYGNITSSFKSVLK